MNENIFDKRRLKTFSNCKELVKSMIGTKDGLIAYNEKFRLDLENTCYKASICEDLQQENQQLKETITKTKTEISALMSRYFFEEDFYIEDTDLDKILNTLEGSDSNE